MIAQAQLTITDLNDPILSGAAPENPVDGMLWLDTSVEPNMLKRYDENTDSWIDAGVGKDYVDDAIDDVVVSVSANTTRIEQLSDEIDIRATTETTNRLSERIQDAELKIAPDKIYAAVLDENESEIDTHKKLSTVEMMNDEIKLSVGQIDVGARNYLFDSEDLGYETYIELNSFSSLTGEAICGLSRVS